MAAAKYIGCWGATGFDQIRCGIEQPRVLKIRRIAAVLITGEDEDFAIAEQRYMDGEDLRIIGQYCPRHNILLLQLLRKSLFDGNLFSLLTAHSNWSPHYG